MNRRKVYVVIRTRDDMPRRYLAREFPRGYWVRDREAATDFPAVELATPDTPRKKP